MEVNTTSTANEATTKAISFGTEKPETKHNENEHILHVSTGWFCI